MRYENFIGGTYQSLSRYAAADRCINWFPEIIESGTGKNRAVLYPTPGDMAFAPSAGSMGGGPIRGLLSAGAPLSGVPRLFAVSAFNLYEVFADGTVNLRGSVGNDAQNTPVQMFPNGNQLGIVSAGQFFLDNGAGPVAVNFQSGGGPVTARTGAFIDGYFIVQQPNSKKFFISELLNGLVWDPLEFGSKEGYPDNIASIIADHEDLWLVGENTTEVWQNTGNAGFPFEPNPNGFIQMGIAAPWTLVRMPDGVGWLAHDTRGGYQAVWCQGYRPKRISTHAIEQIWETYPTVTDAVAYTYIENGHYFWVINFLTGGATWCYDATSGFWHERGAPDLLPGDDVSRCHQFCFGKHLIGSRTSGTILQSSAQIYHQSGQPITRIRIAPHVCYENIRTRHNRLRIAVDGNPPDSTLQISDDGGQTFGGILQGTFSQDEQGNCLNFRRLGMPADRVYRLNTTSDEKTALIDAYINPSLGDGGQ